RSWTRSALPCPRRSSCTPWISRSTIRVSLRFRSRCSSGCWPPEEIAMEHVPSTMRAAVLFGPGDLRVVRKPTPMPGPGEVLVRVAMCGTCATDLKIQEHPFPNQPPFGEFTPGHEWTGTVVALGETVDEFEEIG